MEPTSYPKPDPPSENYMSIGAYYMEYPNADILRYHQGSDHPQFSTLEERTKEALYGYTQRIRIPGKEENM